MDGLKEHWRRAVDTGRPSPPWWQVLLCVALALLLPALVELGLAYSPGLGGYGAYCALWGLVLATWAVRQRSGQPLIALAVLALGLATLHLVPWTSRKVFLADLAQVQPGMTEEQVERVMARYRQLSPPGQATGTRTYGHSREPAFDSDVGGIHFEGGRAVKVEFLPD
jgi:hypothetical protein